MTNKQPPPPAREGTMGERDMMVNLAEAVRVLRLHCDARHDCPCDRCAALRVVLAHAEANASDAGKWRAVRTPNGNESAQRELAQFAKLLVKISNAERQRDALLAALREQGCPSWGRQASGHYTGCGKCVACRADDIVINAVAALVTPTEGAGNE